MPALPFGSYQRHVPGSAQRLVNVMAEQQPLGGKGPTSLIRTPGVRAHKTVGAGPGRGLALHKNELYAVSGTELFRVPLSGLGGAATSLGTIPGAQRVAMRSNSIVLGIVARPDMYTYDGATLAQITDSDFTSRGAVDIDFLDGYFTHIEVASPRWFSSDLYATAYDALKFATAELAPDDLVGHVVNARQAALFGKKTTEVWYNAGANNFPFEKVSGGDIAIGCLGGIAVNDNAEHWLANDLTVRRLNGQTAERRSHHGIEEKLRTFTSLEGAYAFPYASEGHLIYCLQVPDQGTLCLDATTGEWHERASYGQSDWRVCDALEIGGVTYVQDTATGAVGILDPTIYKEWDDPLVAEWTYPNIYLNGRLFFINAFELVLKRGVGLSTGQGSDPEVMLEYSRDGGMTWLSAPTKKFGKLGKYTWRALWTCLGDARDWVPRVRISDPVQVVAFDTRYAIEPGDD